MALAIIGGIVAFGMMHFFDSWAERMDRDDYKFRWEKTDA